MAGELIPRIIIPAAERRGSADEIVTRWIVEAYQPQPIDIQTLGGPFRFRRGLLAA